MKNIFQILIITAAGLSFAQTVDEIKQAKELIRKTGMSETQAKAAAKAQGYTDQQIEAAIQKEKGTKTVTTKAPSKSEDKVTLPDLGKSNEVEQGQSVLETI